MEITNVEKISSGSDILLDLQQAATFLKFKPSWIYQLTHKRRLPYYQKGRKLYFSRNELAEWLLGGRKATVAELEQQAADKGGAR